MVGVLDGNHIRIQCPAGNVTKFHNYKAFFSLVLLAVCDARYCFTLTDIGQNKSNIDTGVLKNSKLGKQFESGAIDLPPPRTANGSSFGQLSHFLVGDEVLPFKT